MIPFNETDLQRELSSLSELQQLAFGIILCERMLRSMDVVERGYQKNLVNCRRCMVIAWSKLANGSCNEDYEQLAASCMNEAPDTENLDGDENSLALSIALSVSNLMEFMGRRDTNHIAQIAEFALDTAAFHAQRAAHQFPRSLSYVEIMKDPVVQNELTYEMNELAAIRRLDSANGAFVSAIRKRVDVAPVIPPVEYG